MVKEQAEKESQLKAKKREANAAKLKLIRLQKEELKLEEKALRAT